MNKDFEKFKQQLIEQAPKMVSMPICNYDDEEEQKIMVAVLLHRGALKESVEEASFLLDEADTKEELLQYLKEERRRTAQRLKKLDAFLNGGW